LGAIRRLVDVNPHALHRLPVVVEEVLPAVGVEKDGAVSQYRR
jgi:hypothetical protein